MGREILFRGKRIDNGKWIEGSHCPKKTGHYEGDKFVEETQHLIIVNMTGGGYQYADVDLETVCEYTGLADKNGRKIFEGDIVTGLFNSQPITGYIKYGSNARYFIEREGLYGIYLDNARDWLEVIGNIFDNPELLEVHNEKENR